MNDEYRDQHNQQNQYLPLQADQRAQGHLMQEQELGLLANPAQNLQPNLQQDQINEEIRLKKKAEGFVGEIFYQSVVTLTCIIFVMVNHNTQCGQAIPKWLSVYSGICLSDMIFTLYLLHILKKARKENIYLMTARYLNLVFQVSWLIYGNVIYYDYDQGQTCQQGGWRLGLFLMVLLGYVEMLKCFCLTVFICILIPILFFAVRRAQRPQWMPAAPQFIQALYRTKFNPEANQAFSECAICMVEFQQTDDIIPLPCDEKHYFHQDCIKQWLEKNNNCPLCKKEITKEALSEQKKKLKNNRR